MKTIKIQQYTPPNKSSVYIKDKKYSIRLGNGYEGIFGSRESVISFLHETNTFLNNKMHELNFIFAEAFTLYRCAWFYLDNKKAAKLSSLEDKIKRNIAAIEHGFTMLTNRSHLPNGNYLVFKHFSNIANNLSGMLSETNILFIAKGQTDRIYRVRQLVEQIENINVELKSYPITEKSITEKIKKIIEC